MKTLVQKFMDIRKRAFRFPELGRKAKFIGIPTTSGTGSEVTPFTVISDGDKKYPIADYSLTPTIAIVDPSFTMTVPASVTADTGLDVPTHAVEAYVSVLANDFTDGLALQAIKLVFEFLERSYKHGSADPEARERMHNASTIAGMAFANAFLGMNHSLSHKVGGNSTPRTAAPTPFSCRTLSATTARVRRKPPLGRIQLLQSRCEYAKKSPAPSACRAAPQPKAWHRLPKPATSWRAKWASKCRLKSKAWMKKPLWKPAASWQ